MTDTAGQSTNRSLQTYFSEQMNPKVHSLLRLATEQMLSGMKLNAVKNFKKITATGLENDQEVLGCVELCLGFLENSKGMLDTGLEHYQKGLEYFFNSFGIKCELTGVVTANIGSTFIEMEDYVQALDFQKSATTIIENLENTEFIQATLNYNLAMIHHKLGNFSLSLEICKRSLEEHLSFCQEIDPRIGDLFSLIADNLWRMKVFEDAMDFLSKSHRIYLDSYGENHIRVAHVLEKLAIYYTDLKEDQSEALKSFETALKIKQKLLGDHPMVANTYANMAKFYQNIGDVESSIKYLEKFNDIIVPILQNLASSSHDPANASWMESFAKSVSTRFARCMHMMISHLYNQGKHRQAKDMIKLTESTLPRDGMNRSLKCFIASIRAMTEMYVGSQDKAYTLATKAVEITKIEFGPKHFKTIEAMFRVGLICKDLGKKDEALIYLSSAAELAESQELPDHASYFKFKDVLDSLINSIN